MERFSPVVFFQLWQELLDHDNSGDISLDESPWIKAYPGSSRMYPGKPTENLLCEQDDDWRDLYIYINIYKYGMFCSSRMASKRSTTTCTMPEN